MSERPTQAEIDESHINACKNDSPNFRDMIDEANSTHAQEVEEQEVLKLAKDAARLNWLSEHGAFISWSRDGEVCNVWLSQDPNDDSNGSVPAEGYPQKCYYDMRAAIDAVMANELRGGK